MRLLWKHLLRSIRRTPWQPLLILLTLSLSVSVAITAYSVEGAFKDYNDSVTKENTSLGDVLISLKGDSDIRMLFAEDVQKLVGDRAEVLGAYELSAFCKDADGKYRAWNASAVDLEAADRYFRFQYLEYGIFNTQNLSQAIIISDVIAQAYDLNVGDCISLRILDENVKYTVEAIAHKDGILLENDILISITGVVELLADRVPAVSALGDGFSPYNQLMLRIESTEDVEEVLVELTADSFFSDYQIKQTGRQVQSNYAIRLELTSIRLIAVLLLVLCGILIGTSLKLMQKQRSLEYALFSSVGASQGHLAGLQLLESLLYSFLGCVTGALLAPHFIRFVCGGFGWSYGQSQLRFDELLFAVLFSVFLMLLCTALDLLQRKQLSLAERMTDGNVLSPTGKKFKKWILPAVFVALLSLLLTVLPVSMRLIPGLLLLLSLIWLLYHIVDPLFSRIAAFLEHMLERSAHPSATLLLSIKNIRNHAALRHVGRLLCVLLAILMVAGTCGFILGTQIKALDQLVMGELIAVNAPIAAEEELRKDPAVAGCARFDYASGATLEGQSVMALIASGDAALCLQPEFLPSVMPKPGEIALPVGVADLIGADVGDTVNFTLYGVSKRVTVYEIQKINSNMVFLHESDMVSSRDLLCIRFTDEASSDLETHARISALLSDYGVVMLDSSEVVGSLQQILNGFLNLVFYAVLAGSALVLVGAVNALVAQYDARKREAHLLMLCGMRKRSVLLMYLLELLVLLVLTVLTALFFGCMMCIAIDIGVSSTGLRLFV